MLVVFACTDRKAAKRPGTFASKNAEEAVFLISRDSVKPVIIPVDESKLEKVIAGKPAVIPVTNNSKLLRATATVMAGSPRVNSPGSNGFQFPEKIATRGRPAEANMPEVFVAKDMIYNSPNPAGFSVFGKQHGLKHGIVTCLLEDSLGNIWFGTAGGVSKFDGRFFTNYTTREGLSSNDVRSILQDRKGNIWFGTLGGGVSKYDGKSFTHFTSNEGLSNNIVFSIREDMHGNIWFGTWGGGIVKYDGQTLTHYGVKQGLINDSIHYILEDRPGNIWIGTKGGLSKFDGKSFSNFTHSEGISNNDVYNILEDKSGNIWLGTIGGGVSQYDGKTFTHLTYANGLLSNDVNFILEDRYGDIWFGTAAGISRFDGSYVTQYTEREGLSNNNIYTLMEDKYGNIWIGTGGGGVSKHNHQAFRHFTDKEGLSKNYIFSIGKDKNGNLWFGSWGGGVSKYDGKNFYNFTQKQGLNHNDIRSILEDKNGNLWFASYKGVSKYDSRSFVHFTEKEGLVNNDVNDIYQDKLGNLWFATAGGATRYDGSSFKNFTAEEGLIDGNVYCITGDRSGNIWFGTNGGIAKYDGHSFFHISSKERPVNFATYSIYEDKKGNMWFGTAENGLIAYDGKFMICITEKEGLVNNSVSSILEDRENNIWFGTRFGLSKLTPEKADLLSEKAKLNLMTESDNFFRNYTYTDGFIGIGCNYNSILEADDGTIWIGTNRDVTAIYPRKIIADREPPNIQITDIKLFNEKINWAKLKEKKDSGLLLSNGVTVHDFCFEKVSNWYHLPEQLSLAYNNNYISFDFIGITMNQPQNVKYQYQLGGIDKNRSILTSQTSASYGNLPNGNYTFKVRAMSSEGFWSDEVKYSFIIRPPWWKTWWFRILAIAFVSALVFFTVRAIYNYQLRKQKLAIEKQFALQYERQRISSDLHDDIGSTLSSINIYAGLAKKESNNQFYLDSINQNINEVVGKLDDLVWSINPRNDTLENIAERLYGYAEPAAKSKNIVFTYTMNEAIKKIKLPAEVKHHLYMTAKELINNAIKHSGCSNINVRFDMPGNKLLVTISDDGTGFDPKSVRKDRNGLSNIGQRAKEMNAEIEIQSHPGGGSLFTILVPV